MENGSVDADNSSLRVDAFNHRVGIGTASPGAKLDVNGNMRVDGATFNVDAANGCVGIGTTAPTKGKLEINGWVAFNNGSYRYLAGDGEGSASGQGNYSIFVSDRIACSEVNAFSDERIKTIKGRSDSAADLKTLMGIEITDYTFKDTVAKGNAPQKKVIAQQVEKIYPQAVSKVTEVVPDIYQKAEVKNGWIKLNSGLPKKGERVRIITEKKTDLYEVLEVSKTGFRVNLFEDGQVFVYGREVDDFHTVDYEAIAMLNVSATQQQQKEMEQQQQRIERLESENASLKIRLEKLEQLMIEGISDRRADRPGGRVAGTP